MDAMEIYCMFYKRFSEHDLRSYLYMLCIALHLEEITEELVEHVSSLDLFVNQLHQSGEAVPVRYLHSPRCNQQKHIFRS